jgi:hypothetical protein
MGPESTVGNAMDDVTDPIWIECENCDEYWCNIHEMHAFECDCPPLEVWAEWDINPYLYSASAYMSEE